MDIRIVTVMPTQVSHLTELPSALPFPSAFGEVLRTPLQVYPRARYAGPARRCGPSPARSADRPLATCSADEQLQKSFVPPQADPVPAESAFRFPYPPTRLLHRGSAAAGCVRWLAQC